MWLRLLSGRRRFWMLSRQDAHTSARAMERLYKKKLIRTDLNNAITVGAPSVYGMDKHQRNLTKMWSLERREAAKITNPEKAKALFGRFTIDGVLPHEWQCSGKVSILTQSDGKKNKKQKLVRPQCSEQCSNGFGGGQFKFMTWWNMKIALCVAEMQQQQFPSAALFQTVASSRGFYSGEGRKYVYVWIEINK